MAFRHINMHPGPPTLQTIPLELQWKIFESLDYRSAIFLTATSHFYRSASKPPLSFQTPADKLAFLTTAERFPQHKDRYVCFSCQTIKPHDQFAIKQITKKYKKRNARSGARFCLDCGVSKNIYTRGQQVQKSDGNNYWKCCSCNLLKRHEFCFVCTKCSDCLSLPNGFGGNGCPSCGERWNTQDHDNSGYFEYLSRQV